MHTSSRKISGLECKNCNIPAARNRVVYIHHELSTCSSVEMCLSNQRLGTHPFVRCVIERVACVYARARAKHLTVSRKR